MSFAILRHGKIKSTSRGAAIAHNHRLGEVDQVNIDKDQKHLNRCFMGDGLAGRIAELLPTKVRKDAVVSVEVLLTSGPEFFDGIEKDRAKLATNSKFLDWVKASLAWAKKEFGDNLVDATLHMDESTPHLHLMAVPLTKDGRLCAKEVMARTEMQRRQTGYAEVMKPFGLKRGEPATETKRRHIGLKEEAGSGGRASQLAAQLAKIKVDYEKATRTAASQQKLNISNFHLINKLQAESKSMQSIIQIASARDLELVAEITELRKTNKHAQASIEQLQAINRVLVDQARERLEAAAPEEASKTAQEAFLAEWQAIGKATALEAKHGTPVAVSGRLVVLHVGRGKHVLHEVPEGHDIPKPQQTEKSKKGLER